MVRTRHRLGPSEEIDDDDEASPKFFSLETEKNRKSMKSNNIIEDSGDRPSHTYSGRNAYNIFEEKVVDSRLRPRTGPRAYNYLDVDSSDEEFRRTRQQHCQRSTFGSRGSRQLKQEMMEEQRKGSTHQLRRRPSEAPDHSLTEEEDEEHKDNSCRRTRSSRIRRQIYHSLNQSHLFRNLHQDKDELDGRHDQSDVKDQDSDDDQTFSDMYSRVKRKRVQVKRNMYGVPINEDSDSEPDERNRNNSKNDEEGEDDEDEDDDDGGEEEENEKEDDDKSGSLRIGKFSLRKRKPCKQVVKSYSLREHKPRTDLYKAPVEERKNRRIDHSIFAVTPTKKSTNQTYQSPAQRINIRKRSAFHSSSSSTSSSSDSESSDEKKFKHRKAKSMAKARKRMMPMNFSTNALPAGSVIKDRVKSGASLADVEPMNIDKNVTFNSIGGLGKHIRALKEMVVFPLLYDKVFQRFKVDPPRGVLFYGPPGTGKTLVARALANECSNGDKRVAFFMRKGADCLSKWVGESERQLRLLFDQAYKFRPSIIFFDEIDGLAPVRSSRQDQIHSSIVSTLLALMDGLDSRGEIVVIGATNRIDSLDPALRRPGRFDREFLFSLPPLEARKQILKIHTASWTPKLNDNFISELAGKCVGYCGADLKALCTEAAMLALRRRYPQIYISNEALQLDVSSINVSAKDFFDAVSNIIPTSQRAVNTPARALSPRVCPLLQNQLNKVMDRLGETYPPCVNQVSSLDAAATSSQAQTLAENGAIWEELGSDEDEDTPSIFVPSTASSNNKSSVTNDERYSNTKPLYLNYINYATSRPTTFRPRLILVGHEGQGQTNYIARAVIHKMESLPVHVLDLPALYAVTAKTPEESCANVFHEAKRKCPSIIYLPYINQWWDVMAETLRATLLTLIQDLDPSLPLLLLATSEQPYYQLDPVLQSLFSNHCGEVFKMSNPDNEERRMFFKDLLLQQACRPPPQRKQAAQRMLEVLPVAAASKPRELTKEELELLVEKEELTLMELRIFLRDVLNKLGSDKKFSIFAKPVNIEDAFDYYEVIEHPMDLSTMMSKIDLHEYVTVQSFLNDINLVCSNALEYNPDRGPMDRIIRNRACALKDTAYAIIKTELDKDFEKMCVEIEESRKRRGQKSTCVPNFYYTQRSGSQQNSRSQPTIPSYLENLKPVRSIPKPEGERYSRRVRGLNIDPTPPLESVEKVYRAARSAASPDGKSKSNDTEESSQCNTVTKQQTLSSSHPIMKNEDRMNTNNCLPSVPQNSALTSKDTPSQNYDGAKSVERNSGTAKRRKTSTCVWCRPKRKRHRLTISKIHNIHHRGGVDREVRRGKEESTRTSKPLNQQLTVDVAENSAEDKDVASHIKVSSSHKSPSSNPVRVSSRRSSMSPQNIGISSASTSILSPTRQASSSHHSAGTNNAHQEAPSELQKLQEAAELLSNGLSTAEMSKESKTDADSSSLFASPHPCGSAEKLNEEKSSVVKRLDLAPVIVDSGVGSSVDSNGDSRDSTDHSRLQEGDGVQTGKICKTNDWNQNCNAALNKRARAILNESSKTLVIDNQRLTALLEKLVCHTEGANVERLEKIYSHLSLVIYRHRHEYNRTNMIMNLEKKVDDLVMPSTSTPCQSKPPHC